ncbi:MAG: pseudaminic acid synthase [Planctomycetaceae bacterium]|nr:pseudaminic acid synthase [Planctomycetaceae bacterium]
MKFANLKKCFIIAEVSANHGQSLTRALAMIRKAAACGADAVKFQTYTPDTLTLDCDKPCFRIKHPKWGGQTLHQLYRKAYTPWKWFAKLKRAADDEGLIFLSTVFDRSSVDLLEDLGVVAHKIASFELVDTPLIEYAAATGKPLILSTGMASEAEIARAVKTALGAGAAEVALLKCVSSYPAPAAEMNLRTIASLAGKFKCPVGLSDHTLGTSVSVAAVAMGARIIEKHFTLSRTIETPDTFFSIEPDELQALVESVRLIEQALGSAELGPTPCERASMVFRRSLFAVADIAKGERFTSDNVRSIRPAGGLEPRHLKKVLGKKSIRRIARGTPLRWDMIG